MKRKVSSPMNRVTAMFTDVLRSWRRKHIRHLRHLAKVLRWWKTDNWIVSPVEDLQTPVLPDDSFAGRMESCGFFARINQCVPGFSFSVPGPPAEASTVGIALLPLAEAIHDEVHRVNEGLEALTRLFKFDTENIHYHPNLDLFLRRPAEASQWIGAQLPERLEHLLSRLHENVEAACQYVRTHALVAHPHSLHNFLPDALDHIPHADFVLPVIPVLFIALKEIKILMTERATLEQVIKHGLIQVGSITLCGFLGKKVGVVMGFWLGGVPGAVIGGVICSFGGGLAGRTIGRKINMAAFEAAVAQWRSDENDFHEFLEGFIPRIERLEIDARQEHEEALKEALLSQRKLRLRPLQEERQTVLCRFCDSFPSLLRHLWQETEHAEKQYLDMYGPTFLNKFFPSCTRIFAAKRIKKAFGKARGRLESIEVEYSLLGHNDRWEFIRQSVGRLHTGSRKLQAQLTKLSNDLGDLKKRAAEEIESLRPVEGLMRSESEGELVRRLNKVYSDSHEELRPRLAKVEDSKRKMVEEGRAIGLDFDAAA
jgi:hypothetical protein